MSAESPKRVRAHQAKTGVGPTTVSPQQVTDPTILDSVAGFINEVVPAGYSVPCENDDKVQWAHFEQLESDESTFASNYDGDNVIPPPLILVLGYSNGVQIWAIPATGDATEILSWRHSCLRVLKFLPTPYKTSHSENVDLFAAARPLIAVCDSSANYDTVTFKSLKCGIADTVKQIPFKSSVLNVLANRHSVVITFPEKIAVFDAFTLESRLSITTCYLSPGIQTNPVAMGARWLAYAEKKIISAFRSGGGNEGEGVQSYKQTVIHAAKSLGRGLREFTETVATSLTGNPNLNKLGTSPASPQAGGLSDVPQKGVVTILDLECPSFNSNAIPVEAVMAHFVAHTDAVVHLAFDPTGLLLVTADKRGHDFHVFRIHPHPGGPALAAVHHLYILHRGDTSAKVQDMCFAPDSRWVAVSTLRGTTHVFPVTPYGGNVSLRTHATAHVVNKMSRYQRSAGLAVEGGRSSSPVSLIEQPVGSLFPYRNPRFPPYPQPIVVNPLAQIRQPVYVQSSGNSNQRSMTGRQRLSSSSEDSVSLRVVGCFAPPRAWIEVSKMAPRETTFKRPVKPVESLFVMSCYGALVQYDLEPQASTLERKERISHDSPIELEVCAKAQWMLLRQPNHVDLPLPMSEENLNLLPQSLPIYKNVRPNHDDDQWLSQVEIVTHLGPHRRLWMGPQITFKTYTIANGSVLETKSVDVRRSKPVNMPVSKANAVLIESSSASSCEQFLLDAYQPNSEETGSDGEIRLKEDLAEAMMESPGTRDTGGRCVLVSVKQPHAPSKVVNPLGTVVTVQSDDDDVAVETAEDAVIHENCDEALFRPTVAPKAIFYSEAGSRPKPGPTDRILTKSLEANTEVAVRILEKGRNKTNKTVPCNIGKHIIVEKAKSSRELSPKPTGKSKTKERVKTSDVKPIIISKPTEPEPKAIIVEPKPRKSEWKVIHDVTDDSKPIDFEFFDDFPAFKPKINTRSITTEEESPKLEKFVDAEDCEKFSTFVPIKPEPKTTSDLDVINSSEEERSLSTRKSRKPKTKLGVKIPTALKERNKVEVVEIKSEETDEVLDISVVEPPPRRPWNVMAAAKPRPRESPEKSLDPPLDYVENFTFRLPSTKGAEIDTNLIDIIDSRIDLDLDLDLNLDEDDGKLDFNLLKSSDDEKADSGSSPAETTESDDSSKVPVVANIMDMDEDTVAATQNQSASKASKRKPKKKRK